MMRKILKVQLLLVGMSLIMMPYGLGGCSLDEELVFFSEEATIQETEEAENDREVLEADTVKNDASEAKIVVYLCGAVKTAGVVVLPEGSRMNDAVQAAGGFTEDAAVTAVNLAAKLADEEMIYVPTIEEVEKGLSAAAETAQGISESGLVNINTADVYTLCSLPGIGESKARDIVTYREENGAFQKKEDIMQIAGIKENLYRQICDLISVK